MHAYLNIGWSNPKTLKLDTAGTGPGYKCGGGLPAGDSLVGGVDTGLLGFSFDFSLKVFSSSSLAVF